MSHGKVLEIGDPETIARLYNKLNFATALKGEEAAVSAADVTATLQSDATITDAWCEDEDGARVAEQEHGRKGVVAMQVEFHATVEDPIFTATFRNGADTKVFSASSSPDKRDTGTFAAGDRAVVRLSYDNWLAAGRYAIEASVARHGTGADVLDYRPDAVSIVVHGARPTIGVVDLPSSFEVTPL